MINLLCHIVCVRFQHFYLRWQWAEICGNYGDERLFMETVEHNCLVLFYPLLCFWWQFATYILFLFKTFAAVRADRMRGGRNKFGPMYKRDRARKLQILRQRQLALQAIRGSIGGGSSSSGTAVDGAQSQLSPTGHYPPYTNMHIKQEIQIPQVTHI